MYMQCIIRELTIVSDRRPQGLHTPRILFTFNNFEQGFPEYAV